MYFSLRSSAGLTWHDGAIPSNEIWVKLGGDKGRGSFKLNLQLVNTSHPNSMKGTALLSVFKAGDTVTNLHTALDMYREHVIEAQGMQIKYKNPTNPSISCIITENVPVFRNCTVRMFLSGDYEYLCRMYGLSGASGMFYKNK